MKTNIGLLWLFLLIAGLFPLQGFANENKDRTGENQPHVKVEMIQEEETIAPGRPFWVAIHLTIEPEWHVYWKNPGDAGVPVKVEWALPPGFTASPLEWPFPEKFSFEDLTGFGYENEVTLLAQLTPPKELQEDIAHPLKAKISWLVCSPTSCQPGEKTLEIPLTVSGAASKANALSTSLFAQAKEKIPAKHLILSSTRKEGFIQLELPQIDNLLDDNAQQNIYFFPEEQNQLDLSWPQTISQSERDSKRLILSLKEGDEAAQNEKLQGILILPIKKQNGEIGIEAIVIDSATNTPNASELTLASAPGDLIRHVKHTASETDEHSFEGGLALALAFAFIGGMILNLMPCVLPVMSFKVMGFVKMAGQSRSLTFRHGLIFSLGVIVSFWVLASAILSLRAYGEVVGWGFQLQHPLFVVVLATILFVFALSLFGLFEWGMFLSSWAGEKQVQQKKRSSDGYASSFFSGVLATAVATPCTGPFLGSAVGFALTLPSFQALLIFTSLGMGMSFPYLLLAGFPACLKFLPRPGPWMETFKQLMGFVLMATVLWLTWVFSAQTNSFSIICLLAGFFLLSLSCWIYGKGCVPSISKKKRILAFAFVALFAYLGVRSMLFPVDTWDVEETPTRQEGHTLSGWQNFSPELVSQLKQEGRPVLIDFTAKWCLICQTNHLVLNSGEVVKSLDKAGVVRIKADWTKNDPTITEELRKFGRNSVPLYVLYKPGEAKATILPQVLTPDVVLSYLEDAESKEEIALND